jgi:hypothetical protein
MNLHSILSLFWSGLWFILSGMMLSVGILLLRKRRDHARLAAIGAIIGGIFGILSLMMGTLARLANSVFEIENLDQIHTIVGCISGLGQLLFFTGLLIFISRLNNESKRIEELEAIIHDRS